MHPEFAVPGVRPEDIWQLFNVGNYHYYLLKVKMLQEGSCPFCIIDPAVNEVIPIENDSWVAIHNKVSPKSGQEHQFVIPLKRHIENVDHLTGKEWSELGDLCRELSARYWIKGGALLVRSGEPARNAKSMPHLHFNYHVPTGRDRVEITIAKAASDLANKLPVLQVFEEMRVLKEKGFKDPFKLFNPAKQALVADKLGPTGSS